MNKFMIFQFGLMLLSLVVIVVLSDALQPLPNGTPVLFVAYFFLGASYYAFFDELRRTVTERHRRQLAAMEKAAVVRKQDLRPDVAEAFDMGTMTDEQMEHLLSKTGHNRDGMN